MNLNHKAPHSQVETKINSKIRIAVNNSQLSKSDRPVNQAAPLVLGGKPVVRLLIPSSFQDRATAAMEHDRPDSGKQRSLCTGASHVMR